MSFGSIITTVFLSPLQLLFEVIFLIANQLLGSPGRAIFALSLSVNLLLMPLYRKADTLQKAEREAEKRLENGVAHIKRTFKGDERMMILQAYYRENHYKPTYALRGAAPLLLEIPFFLAAYRFLSGLTLLQQMPFGPITDLSQPDGLLQIGSVAVNLLPILMTAVNLASGAVFTKGSTKKEKIQLYLMAVFFLVFLYRSPSGLVLYWTLNNVFSLLKNIYAQIPRGSRYIKPAVSLCAIAVALFGLITWKSHSVFRLYVCLGFCVVIHGILLLLYIAEKHPSRSHGGKSPSLLLCGLYLTAFVGLLISSNVIGASPAEFVDSMSFYHPLWFVVSAACMAFGTFVVWTNVFARMAKPETRRMVSRILCVFCGVATVDYMFFGLDLGKLSTYLVYDNGLSFEIGQILLNLLVIAAVAAIFYYLSAHFTKQLNSVLAVCIAAIVCVSGYNAVKINTAVAPIRDQVNTDLEDSTEITLSKNGKNVVILMLDRGIGTYIPYIFNENPALAEKFDGFTHYMNSISYGPCTKIGVPALYGGYEYTPIMMNTRTDQTVKEKHNEALKVLPKLFSDNGYHVTVLDPPFANYSIDPDLSIFDGMENVDASNTMSRFSDAGVVANAKQIIDRNLFCFGLTKSVPLIFQNLLYDNGNYNQCDSSALEGSGVQITTGAHTARGISSTFMDSYRVLQGLPDSTVIAENGTNELLLMANKATHEPVLLQEPDYTPEANVDNTQYDAENADRFTLEGHKLNMDQDYKYASYQSNMAALIQVGNWLDYLRENDVYDNTRIIIVSDHGRELLEAQELIMDDLRDLQQAQSLLMVKDFGSSGAWKISWDFMTQADVPTLASQDLIEDPVNPYTGNPISSDAKLARDQYVYLPSDWNLVDTGTQYLPGAWMKVHNNFWDKNDWTVLGDGLVLTEDDVN